MPVLSRDDYMTRIKSRFGESLTDDDVSFLEDMSDTYDDLAKRSNEDYEKKYNDMITKYDELDKSWRDKYTARFFGNDETSPDEVKEEQTQDVQSDGEETDFEDLFTEREG